MLRVPLGAAGPHTLALTVPTADFYLGGVIEYNGDENAGIRLLDGSRSGRQTYDFVSSTQRLSSLNQHAAALAPSLVIIATGKSDLLYQTPTRCRLTSQR